MNPPAPAQGVWPRAIRLTVNGETQACLVEPRRSLADCLRHDLGFTGTHVGCEHGVCGCCTVLLGGQPVRSCLLFAVQADGGEILTVEGLARNGTLHPIQQAFWEEFALQCGFCTPGFLLTALAFLRENPDPTPEEVRRALSGNLCRCTGYHTIVRAVLAAAARLRAARTSPESRVPSPESNTSDTSDPRVATLNPRPGTPDLGLGTRDSGLGTLDLGPGTAAAGRWIGRPVRRVEDPRVLAGHGTYVDDLHLPRMVEVAFVRSPHAHARLVRVDVERARRQPGVAAVLTGDEAARHAAPWRGILLHYPGMKTGPQYPLALDRVRYVGEPVVAVAAASRAAAEDACELVAVEYEPLPALLDPEAALRPEAPRIHDELEDNRILHAAFQAGDVEAAFHEANRVVRHTFHFARHTGVTIEPRSLVAQFEPATRSLTLWVSTQVPHMMQAVLAALLGLEEHRIRVIAPDVGGSFGIKIHVYQDDVAACLLAVRSGRPVKWVADRRESFLADIHAREQQVTAELAVRADGALLGLRAHVVAPVGAWSAYPRSSVVEGSQTVRLLPGPYRVRNYASVLDVVAQHKVITSQYRAVGHPIAAACMDGMLDLAARGLGLDPAEIRLRNLLRRDEFPYTSITGSLYDSGSYRECLERLLDRAGYAALRREQAALRRRGVHQGIGLCCFVEITGPGAQFYGAGGAPISGQDGTTVRVEPTGKVTALVGVTDQGQGTHTTMAQIVAEHLGVDVQDVKVISGDTAATPYGGGTWASRSSVVGAGAAILAAQAVRAKILAVAGHLLEANPEDLDLGDVRVIVKGSPGRGLALADVARTVHFQSHKLPKEMEPSLEASNHYTNPIAWTFTNGAHLAQVEVDAETGSVRLLRYAVVEDCGRVINPAIVDGQVRGGVAQGIGGALYEECVYDGAGQLLTTSLMDYLVPGAAEVPDIEVDHLETPSPFTLGGFKGVGEAGTAGAPGAIMNAVNDALLPLGARIDRQPITPERIFLAIRGPR